MRRRDFIQAIAISSAWSFAARAQQALGRMRLVAILSASGVNDQPLEDNFRRRLAELGWQEDNNIRFEVRRAEADINRARRFVAELVAMNPDAFFVTNTQMAQLVVANTHNIPVVFIAVPDPIGSGLVANFARPGGNVTGFTNFEPSVAGKWLEFLKDIVPGLTRVGVILDAGNPTAVLYGKAIEVAAPTFGVRLNPVELQDSGSIDVSIESLAREQIGGLVIPPSALSTLNRDRIVALAARYRLPAMYPYGEFTDAGGLIAYGFDRNLVYPEAAVYVDRILRGEKPSNLPVQTPIKFELTINLKTAKALGLFVPQSMLLLADKVIE